MFTYKTQIRLHDTDAAGILFFANQFSIVHDAYELLLEQFGFSFGQMLKNGKYFLPIVHAESNFIKRLHVGDKISISIKVENIGITSFTFSYTIMKGTVPKKGTAPLSNVIVGTAKTVHVTIDAKKHTKVPLPLALRKKLTEYKN